MKRKIRAYCGFEQSGKGYSCRRLMETMGFEKASFADILRDIAFKTIGMTLEEGMPKYESLKKTELMPNLTFRNILQNLGSAVRCYDRDFWARGILTAINNTHKDICIDDLRYPNEYRVLKEYSDRNGIDFKLIFCDFHSHNYRDDNPHESAAFARFLKDRGYQDQEYVREADIDDYELICNSKEK